MENDPNHPIFLGLLALARQKYGNDSRVAEALKVKPANISQWKDGKHRVPPHTVELLRLLVHEPGKYPEPRSHAMEIDDDGKTRVKAAWREAFDAFTAPIIAYAQGGEGAYPEDLGHAVPRIAVPCKDPNCYVLELEGDSMEPVYLEGDLLVVAPNMQAINNDLVIVKTIEEEVFFKKLKNPARGETFQFHSFNPHHPPLHFRPEQIYRISVVHSVIRPLKERVKAMTVSESAHL